MAYYFYKITNYDITTVQKLYNCTDDGLVFTEPQVEHITEVGDFIIAARNKKEALQTFLQYIYEEEEEFEDYEEYPEYSLESSWEEQMEEYFENAHPDDLPYGGYPYK